MGENFQKSLHAVDTQVGKWDHQTKSKRKVIIGQQHIGPCSEMNVQIKFFFNFVISKIWRNFPIKRKISPIYTWKNNVCERKIQFLKTSIGHGVGFCVFNIFFSTRITNMKVEIKKEKTSTLF
jgi:hypothetical protein